MNPNLFNCPDCNREISTSALNCPGCGRVLKETTTVAQKKTNPNLFNCPDCNRQISTSALNCPDCGRVLKKSLTVVQKQWSNTTWAIIIIVSCVLLLLYLSRNNR
jgi:predicted amidophosphoribosyltransferase